LKWDPRGVVEKWVIPAVVPPLAGPVIESLSAMQSNLYVEEGAAAEQSRNRVICVSGAVVAAIMTFLLTWWRRMAWRDVWLWTGLSLVLGALGLVLWLSLRGWPVLVRCPACGKHVRREDRPCPACGEQHTLARNGTEVFSG
jgi:endogenous inhibitor of DNA gyrase (YacG/DUF329 family)